MMDDSPLSSSSLLIAISEYSRRNRMNQEEKETFKKMDDLETILGAGFLLMADQVEYDHVHQLSE
jgi:hypothetical protein